MQQFLGFFILMTFLAVKATVSMNKHGDLLLHSLLNGDIILNTGTGDLLVNHNLQQDSLIQQINRLNTVIGQICWMMPPHPDPAWELLTPVPSEMNPSYAAATVIIGTKIYLIGGADNNNIATNNVRVYDTEEGTWTDLPSLSTSRAYHYAAATSDGSRFFVFAGFSGNVSDILYSNSTGIPLSSIEEYEFQRGTWVSLPDPLLNQHQLGAMSVIDDVAYFLGGRDTQTVDSFDLFHRTMKNMYDNISTGRVLASAATVNSGTILLMGGYLLEKDTPYETRIVEQFNPQSPIGSQWTTKADFGLAKKAMAATVLDELVFVMGGSSEFLAHLPSVIVNNPRVDKWRTTGAADIPSPRELLSAAGVGNYIYIMGGRDANGVVNIVARAQPCF